eukprot:snap_masked-scaffold_3-processed-gene-16.35-mRNA-1 protein AED:1.00 eAED:1.00 QI:0/0/0/0/1/1/2/0/338
MDCYAYIYFEKNKFNNLHFIVDITRDDLSARLKYNYFQEILRGFKDRVRTIKQVLENPEIFEELRPKFSAPGPVKDYRLFVSQESKTPNDIFPYLEKFIELAKEKGRNINQIILQFEATKEFNIIFPGLLNFIRGNRHIPILHNEGTAPQKSTEDYEFTKNKWNLVLTTGSNGFNKNFILELENNLWKKETPNVQYAFYNNLVANFILVDKPRWPIILHMTADTKFCSLLLNMVNSGGFYGFKTIVVFNKGQLEPFQFYCLYKMVKEKRNFHFGFYETDGVCKNFIKYLEIEANERSTNDYFPNPREMWKKRFEGYKKREKEGTQEEDYWFNYKLYEY